MNNNLDRKSFLKLTGFAGAGLALGGLVNSVYGHSLIYNNSVKRANSYFLPVIFIDDVIRIISASETIVEPIRFSLTHPHGRFSSKDLARISRVINQDTDENMAKLLEEVRNKWEFRNDRYSDEALPEKLAFICGWLMLKGLDNQVGELYPDNREETEFNNPSEVGLYHDTHILRELLISDVGEQEALDNIENVSAEDIADAFEVMNLRAQLKIHTFRTDPEDTLNWVERLVKWHRGIGDLSSRYARVYHSPDPDLKRQYIDDFHFYDREDPIIKRARSLQRGTVAPVDFDLKRTPWFGGNLHYYEGQSKYALALAEGWYNIKYLNSYMLNLISLDEFLTRLTW